MTCVQNAPPGAGQKGGTNSALSPSNERQSTNTDGRTRMAEIRVAPQRRNRAALWIIVIAVIVAAIVAWYFLSGPPAGAGV